MKSQDCLYVERLKDGRFQFRLRYVDPRTGKAHRVSTIKEKNTRQAYNEALRELQDRVAVAANRRLSLDDALVLYLADKKRILRPQTLHRNEAEITRVNAAIGRMYLDSLTVMDVKKGISSISEKNCTYNERQARYKAFLNWCYQNELMEVPLGDKLVPLPDHKKERISEKYLEPEELQALLGAMKQPMWYHLTVFLVLSGLRIGEAIALRMEDVGEKYISVTKTYSVLLKTSGDTKTDTSARDVYIQPELREAIDRFLIFRSKFDSPYFFPGKDGVMQYGAYNKYLRELSERVLDRRISPHALRHTCASLLLANGVSVDTISRRLGHADSKITKEIYLHMTGKLKAADEAALARSAIF